MATATTVVILRDDLSIPGEAHGEEGRFEPAALERRLFHLLDEAEPDVVVLDLSRTPGRGVETISTIQRLSPVPILAVCAPDALCVHDYRLAGAADCIAAPLDILKFNQALQRIVQRSDGRATAPRAQEVDAVAFAGITFHLQQNLLVRSTALARG